MSFTVPSSGQAEQETADLPHITEPASFSIAYGFICTYQTAIGLQICFLDQSQSNQTSLQLVLHEILSVLCEPLSFSSHSVSLNLK